MKKEDLFELIGNADEELLTISEKEHRRKNVMLKITAAVACLCLLVLSLQHFIQIPKKETAAENPPILQTPKEVDKDERQNPKDSDEESQMPEEVNDENLPVISLMSERFFDGMGYAAIEHYHIDQSYIQGPWNPSIKIEKLPVYRNLQFNKAEGYIPVGVERKVLLSELKNLENKLGIQTKNLKFESYASDAPANKANYLKAKYDDEKLEIEIESNGSKRLHYEKKIIPEGYNFYQNTLSQLDAEKSLDYLAERYAFLTGFKNPKKATFGDYNLHAEFSREYYLYDEGQDVAESIVNYNLKRASFSPSDRDEPSAYISLDDYTKSLELVGNYPVISRQKASKLLRLGKYVSSVPYPVTSKSEIAAIDIDYVTVPYIEYWIPFYCFYVKLPQESLDGKSTDWRLQSYGIYYVPAIPSKYIKSMETYEGQFN
ncbi:MAG: hypothetical protein Q4D65_04610 [Peptostreptococcaceae bacterium]|nr:hypothetical protein [Peptostreptococcaceae bacterium]